METEAELLPPDQTPGAVAVRKSRTLPGGYVVEFEAAPVGWLKKDGEPRRMDWRAYFLVPPAEERQWKHRVESVTTICDRILPKDGLPPWSERQGIRGTLEAFRRGLLRTDMEDNEAVAVVRSNRLGAVAERNDAADRGLNVHAILEDYMTLGKVPNPADHPEPHRPFIRGLVRWIAACDPEPEAVEMLVGDPERGYAGRCDLIARIGGRLTLVDLKTQERGAIYESAHVQVRLYREAEERYGEHAIENARIVVADGRGGFREMPLMADSEMASLALAYYQPIKRLTSACDSENQVIRKALEAGAR